VILGLGSNLGDRLLNLRTGLDKLRKHIEIDKISKAYTTASLLRDGQGEYLNICCSGLTALSGEALLAFLKETEKAAGRTDTGRWQSRVLDIDIIDYAGRTYSSESLTVPHPEMQDRSFVLYPLRDVESAYVHPVTGKSVENMIKSIKDDLDIRVLEESLWR
jgi:2-amino-4-hydroxy-6-hydroxymethyldihydropteridine diphosphokinase